MTRLARVMFALAALASLLLCVAAGVLWVRSYYVHDRVCYQTDEDASGVQRYFELGWNRGAFCFEHHHITGLGRAMAEMMGLHTTHDEAFGDPFAEHPDAGPVLAGFRFNPPVTSHPAPATWWRYSVQVPHYAVTLAAAAVTAASVWRLLRLRRRGAAGLCRRCGYDLRASPDRCPECGGAVRSGSPAGA